MKIRTIFKNNKGYTIVELLAVATIIVVIMGLIAGILGSTLRGGSKTRITNDVSQSGNYALSIISNAIINSESVTNVGGIAYSDCTTNNQSATNPTGTSITLKQSDNNLVTFSCVDNTIASQSADQTVSLIDSGTLQVDSSSCSFTCRQENDDAFANPIIDVSFTLKQKTTQGAVDTSASSVFSTSVSMRNYNPK